MVVSLLLVFIVGVVLAKDGANDGVTNNTQSLTGQNSEPTQKPEPTHPPESQSSDSIFRRNPGGQNNQPPITRKLEPTERELEPRERSLTGVRPSPGASDSGKLKFRFREENEFAKAVESEKEKAIEKVQTLRTTWQTARANFLEKVETIKDEKKKEIVKKIDGSLNTVNANQVKRMKDALDRMQKIAAYLSTEVGKLKTIGKDTTVAEAAINNAQQSILAAQSAVTTQGEKTYAPTLTTDQALQQNVTTEMQALRVDLLATQKLVIAARDALLDTVRAIRALVSITISQPAPTQEASPTAIITQ